MVAQMQRVGVRNFVAVIAAVLVSACGGGDARSPEEPGASPALEVGQTLQALGTAPETGCTGVTYNGHDYWFCPPLRTWATARTKCESKGYNLVRVEDSAENEFVRARVGLGAWMGSNDITTEGAWVWTFGGSQFWTGTATGTPFGGLYSKWGLLQPDNFLNQDCGRIALDGTWTDEACSNINPYVCESGTDQCPADPQKVIPGVCGCGVADIDSDGDGTLDCQDQCPNDATKIVPGDCGCSNAPKAAGTACSDGLCNANTACNGAGVCGNPASCPAPDGTCRSGVFQNHYYWFCDNDRSSSDARQRCKNVGTDLAAIESAAEDTFIGTKATALDDTLVGGSDQAVEGTFVWQATSAQFWAGGPTGAPSAGAYVNWEPGEPSDGLFGQDCMAKDAAIAGGKWEATSCTAAEAYACERTDLCPLNPLKSAPGQCGCAVPDTDTDLDGTADCIDACPADPHKAQPGTCGCGAADVDSDGDGLLDCQDGCPHDATNAACTGALPPALPPFQNPGATPIPQTPVDQSTCNAEQGVLLPNPNPPVVHGDDPRLADIMTQFQGTPGGQCARAQDPEVCALDPSQVNDPPCTSDATCPTGFICGKGIPTSCATDADQTSPAHRAKCGTKTLHCSGLLHPECGKHLAPVGCTGTCACADPTSPSCPCTEYPVCSLSNATGDSGPADPHVYDPEPAPALPLATITAAKAPPPTPTYSDPPDSCAATSRSGNCWCALGMNAPGAVTEDHSRAAHHGSGSFLTLDFNPEARFDAQVTPLPFGEAQLNVNAGAAFTAAATSDFFGNRSHITLIDFFAGVHAERCSLSTAGTRFKVLGVDFVDLFGNAPFDASSSPQSTDCGKALKAFTDAGDRAKKALRDAQVVLDLYRQLPAGHSFDKASFCSALEVTHDDDFPPQPPGTGTCTTAPIEVTINRYIAYYATRVQDLRDAITQLDVKGADLENFLGTQGSASGDIPFLRIQHQDSAEFAKFNFFVGPIPVVITMDAALNYAVNGDLDFRFTPTNGLALNPGSATQLIAAAANLVPSATASMDVFAGVGIDLGVIAVDAGIEGQLILGTIRANLSAGAGLSLAALADNRGDQVGDDLRSLGTGAVLFPERQYDLSLDWFYGADLALTDVLKVNLNARVELSAFLFSVTFRKTLLSLGGFNLPTETLLHGGGQLAGRLLPSIGDPANTLGRFAMQLPFVELVPRPVPLSDTRIADRTFTVPTTTQIGFHGYCDSIIR